ncbi:MAG: ATP synthase F1 subunit delta [Pelagibacterales bacterium]|nr:ATP synthase F1 subunit delta [Pelagibacterales bacterium]|tara:strand:+ start:1137 stop:1712 length:576 start_codon:yes stop_codon:yes gene_type:complete
MVQNSQLINRSVVRYSNALYSLSVDKKIQNKMYEECKSLLRTFSENPNFSTIFKSQLLNKKKQISVVSKIFSEKKEKKLLISKDLLGLIILLAKNARLNILEEVLKSYIELHTADNKEIKVNVTSVIKINDSLENKLKKILSKNGKLKVKIINLIDKDLLGGLIIQIGSNLIDTSIKTKLNKVKNAMKGAN